jgi:hypothetical protein
MHLNVCSWDYHSDSENNLRCSSDAFAPKNPSSQVARKMDRKRISATVAANGRTAKLTANSAMQINVIREANTWFRQKWRGDLAGHILREEKQIHLLRWKETGSREILRTHQRLTRKIKRVINARSLGR